MTLHWDRSGQKLTKAQSICGMFFRNSDLFCLARSVLTFDPTYPNIMSFHKTQLDPVTGRLVTGSWVIYTFGNWTFCNLDVWVDL